MDQYVTGALIKALREKQKLTQLQLSELLGVSDKTVSKWETGKGYPDVTLLLPLAGALGISVAELMTGTPVRNANVSGNMLRSKFCVCPVCGNVIHSMGTAALYCHGILLLPSEPEPAEDGHRISVELSDDEYYVRIDHEMTKTHYISFVAAISPDTLQLKKLYPEGNAEARFRMNGVRRICIYCNRDGLFYTDVNPRRPSVR